VTGQPELSALSCRWAQCRRAGRSRAVAQHWTGPVSRCAGRRCRTAGHSRRLARRPYGGESDTTETRIPRCPGHSRRSRRLRSDSRERPPEPCITLPLHRKCDLDVVVTQLHVLCLVQSCAPAMVPGAEASDDGGGAAGSPTSAGLSSLRRAASRIRRRCCWSASAARRSSWGSLAMLVPELRLAN